MVCVKTQTRPSPLQHDFANYSFREGPDGPWASFPINIGDSGTGLEGQTFHIFPALSLSIVTVPVTADFCSGKHATDKSCAARTTFSAGASPSWASRGQIDVISALGLSRFVSGNTTAQNQTYGTDNVGLGTASKESPILATQNVAFITSKDFFLGLFGLSNKRLNWDIAPRLTFLSNLRESNYTTSLSFSYTAGSKGRNSTPSLVFGGYDASRFDPQSTLEVDISDSLHPFPIILTSISFSWSQKIRNDTSIGSSGDISIYIESATPFIWLPISACTIFEEVFGLQWDERAELYLVNSTAHEHMLKMNTTVSFVLSSSRSKTKNTKYTLPYTAFDLIITYPLVDTESYYFPLKRASTPDQYILGRTFLQETHICGL